MQKQNSVLALPLYIRGTKKSSVFSSQDIKNSLASFGYWETNQWCGTVIEVPGQDQMRSDAEELLAEARANNASGT